MYFVETEEVLVCYWWALNIRFGGFAPFFVSTQRLYQIVLNEYDLLSWVVVIRFGGLFPFLSLHGVCIPFLSLHGVCTKF